MPKIIRNFYNPTEVIEVNHAEDIADCKPNGLGIVCVYTNSSCLCVGCAAFSDVEYIENYETQDGQYFKCENCGKLNDR